MQSVFSGMVNSILILSHLCTVDNLVYMLTLYSLLGLIHVLIRQFCIGVRQASLELGLMLLILL